MIATFPLKCDRRLKNNWEMMKKNTCSYCCTCCMNRSKRILSSVQMIGREPVLSDFDDFDASGNQRSDCSFALFFVRVIANELSSRSVLLHLLQCAKFRISFIVEYRFTIFNAFIQIKPVLTNEITLNHGPRFAMERK